MNEYSPNECPRVPWIERFEGNDPSTGASRGLTSPQCVQFRKEKTPKQHVTDCIQPTTVFDASLIESTLD